MPGTTISGQHDGAEMSRDAATSRHLGRLADLGCIACILLYGEPSPAEIHHPRAFAGAGQRAPDWTSIPLCVPHHRMSGGVHGDKTVLRQLNMGEPELLAETLRRVYG